MFKLWSVVCFIWKYLKPIFSETMVIIAMVKEKGLTNEAARKEVFQKVTDFIQARGLEKISDSVLNASIELCYQIYLSENKKG